jgi:transposase-like protein
MDQEVKAFRAAAARANRGRRALQWRYAPALRATAVRYYRARCDAGAGVRAVAVALGIAPWSLYRWTRRSAAAGPFVPVRVTAPSTPTPRLTVVLEASGARVEGLDVETAAQLLALLR